MPEYFLKLYDKDYGVVLEEQWLHFDNDIDVEAWCKSNSSHGEKWVFYKGRDRAVGAAYRQTITDQYMKKGML